MRNRKPQDWMMKLFIYVIKENQEKYFYLPSIPEGTVSKILFWENAQVRNIHILWQNAYNDIGKLNVLLDVQESLNHQAVDGEHEIILVVVVLGILKVQNFYRYKLNDYR